MKRLLLTITLLSSLIYGTQISAQQDTVTDIDGNVYHTVTIGTQVWMVEDLKVTRYNNGIPIQHFTDNQSWSNQSGAYCWFNNDVANKITYGALYNWYAVNTGNLAPKGWHIPSDDEWTVLTDYLGGKKNAGGKMKTAGTSFWIKPNKGADNSSGFSAFPGGGRYYRGSFGTIGSYGYWWTSTETSINTARSREIRFDASDAYRHYYDKTTGFSVRCLKD